nr:MAG TPA_asm: hypothetical protein [Caudoviricetes sp.]
MPFFLDLCKFLLTFSVAPTTLSLQGPDCKIWHPAS